ncbi:hotdog fold thioesterase [Corynebacterium glyciniphilum]|uniref:hotdog fold thioesterase n=1 Tax=Corynebacterium glyciniphilum TaxID=1404244 RepID=UPI00264AD1AF|nr:hotdog fold thioesterase [Corynebacterium glyciniphilum]MDN5682500.1 hotdog fold thioesterase [Corynebacterium glyciniphilum]MDN6707126.1 hotdog fold thioesterase [Corynebacterium glyciniphilum]
MWQIRLGELDEKMGVRILQESPEKVVATMPVVGNRQSLGLLHGGAMVALAEAVGSWAALKHASRQGKAVVGVDINATHHASVKTGAVTATATAIRLGKRVCSHEVVITDDDGRRLCTARISNLVVSRE